MNLIEQIPLNTDTEGNCSCLKANYYKMGGANFIGHTKDGFKATCIMEVIQIGNIVDDTDIGFKNPQRGRVYSSDGLCPCLCDGSGGGGREPKIVEPISCAMQGRNPDNPSERKRSNGKYKQRIEMGSNISNTITSVQKDSLVAEQNVLTPKRTEFGKQVRKQYENKEINMSRHDMTQLEPRQDGVSNTLTSVQKDNLLAEPIIIDDYNQRVPQDQDVIGTVTTQFGNPAPRHGYKIAEPLRIRKLTPRECFRLMGVDDEDIDKIQQSGVSQSQQYKMAGNSIVCDVLYHIFRKLLIEKENENQQLTLF